MSGYRMEFPEDWHDFLKTYSFVDEGHLYTNGSQLIQVFRVVQLVEHMMGEHEPMHPIPFAGGTWQCPMCDTPVGYEELLEGGFTEIRHKFCPECGRRIKWEVDEKDFER